MKKIIISAFFVAFVLVTNAQSYNAAIGLRGGPSAGITGKFFLSESAALEGILATRWGGFNITGLYEVHNKVFNQRTGSGGFDSNRLLWYYGVGGHIGFWNGNTIHPWFKDDRSYTVIGIDGIIGLEYTLKDFPLNFSVDYKPSFNLIGYSGFWGDEGAFSIRYTF